MKKHLIIKSISFISFIILISLSLSACAKSDDHVATPSHPKNIKVALSAEINPPYLYTNKDNEFVGLDMDYMKLLEKELPQYHFQYEIGEEESNLVGIGLIWESIGSLKHLKEKKNFYIKMYHTVTPYQC